jgi:hypothetical protein
VARNLAVRNMDRDIGRGGPVERPLGRRCLTAPPFFLKKLKSFIDSGSLYISALQNGARAL